MNSKPIKLTNNEKAIARVAAILERGEVLHFRGTYGTAHTAGPCTPAVGARGRFAVYSYPSGGTGEAVPMGREWLTAEQAADVVCSCIGDGRAREVAIAHDRKRGRGVARVVPGTAAKRAVVVY